MLKVSTILRLMVILIVEGVSMKLVTSKVYNVGDSDGWTTLVISNYATWASSKNFRVGDTLLFQYRPTSHDVMQVNQHNFRTCNTSAPLKTYKTGNDSVTIKGPGHYYFICSFPGHCDAGQKLDVRVLKKNSTITTPIINASSFNATTSAGPPKMTKMAPSSVATVEMNHSCLFRSIVFLSTIYVAIWVV